MEEELQKLGLNKHEAKVYLANLSLGPVSANQLADNTKIKRATVYLALANLSKEGLVSESFVGKKRLFEAEKPQKLEKLTKRMRRQTIDAEILLENILPGLLKLPKQYLEEPKVTFYPGIEGIKNIALEIASCYSPWYFFGSGKKVLEKLIRFKRMDILHDSWSLRADTNRPFIQIITDSGIRALGKDWQGNKTPWREIKILPNTITTSSGFIIFDDKLAVFSLESKPFAAVIKSGEVAGVLKVLYGLIWGNL